MSSTILDGGMGQELIRRSGRVPTPYWATQVMIDEPALVGDVHDAYFAAGAEVATVNSYALHRDRFAGGPYESRFEELHESACRLAVEARDRNGRGLIAGSLGPLGGSYRGDDGPLFTEAAARFAEIVALQAGHVDLFLCETVPSLARVRSTLEGALGPGKPVWLAVTVDDADGTKLRSGEPVEAVLDLHATWPYDALLVNCSFPEATTTALTRLSGAPVPLGAYANGFTGIPKSFLEPNPTVVVLEARHDLDPDAYCRHAADWVDLGATIVGGCCEVGPAHIQALAERFGAPAPEPAAARALG